MTIIDDVYDALAKIKKARESQPIYAFETRELADQFVNTAFALGVLIDEERVIVSAACPSGKCIVMKPSILDAP